MTQVIERSTNRDDGKLDYASPGATTPPHKPGRAAFIAGWIISAIPILWMGGLGIVIFLFNRALMQDGMAKYGYPASSGVPIFIAELIAVVLYAIPRTAVLGAILLTGYLGGAVATHVRAGEPWFFPVIFGVLVWLGLVLRDPRLRQLVPLRKV
jgi:hypothetical protein